MLQNQSHNTALGSIVAGDQHNHYPVSSKSHIAVLYEQFKAERALGSAEASGVIEDLQHYLDRPAKQMIRSLAEKLTVSGRVNLIPTAEEAKERAMKRIVRFQSSKSAQEIFAYVLGDLHTRFTLRIAPLIARGSSRESVDEAIYDDVVLPIANLMEPSELGLNSSQVFALLFYLAGNCHVQWD